MAKQQLSKRSLKTGRMGGLLASVSVLALMLASPAKADLPCGMNVFNDTNVVNVEETLTGFCLIMLMDGATLRIRASSIDGSGNGLTITGDGSVDIASSEFDVAFFSIDVDNEATINNTQIVADSGLEIVADDISVANADFDVSFAPLRITGDHVRIVNSSLSTPRSDTRITGNDDLHLINNTLDESTPAVSITGSPTGQANIIGNTIDARFAFRIDTGKTRVVGNHIEVGGTGLDIAIVSGRVQNNVLTLDSEDIRVSAANDIFLQGNTFEAQNGGANISGDPCTIKKNTDNTFTGIDTSGCM